MPINGPKIQESCPLRGHWASFRLVDEHGNGEPYAGLSYKLYDRQGQTYPGQTDAEGYGKAVNCYEGPLFLDLSASYGGTGDPWYEELQIRKAFALPLSAIQVAAEQSPAAHRKPGDPHLPQQRAQREDAVYYHVQVRDFVPEAEAAHLPEYSFKAHFPSPFLAATFKDLFQRRGEEERPGVPLEPGRHHVIEVKALRAYSPILSRSKAFCALNNYQLAIMSTFSYGPFNKERAWNEPATLPPYLQRGSIGQVLHNQLAHLEKPTLFNNAGPYHLLWEEVPYSKRLEVVPHNPERYVKEKADGWDCPEKAHFLNHETDTQAFITHNDKVVLISIRGTQEFGADGSRDADARQIPHEDGLGQAHRGFHGAFTSTKEFISRYLDAFFTGEQTILVTGHSLGGAIALLAAEWIRRLPGKGNVVLYTYGAPRAGDAAFVKHAKDLTHYRVVNHNDPVPGVPFTSMDSEWKTLIPATAWWLASLGSNPIAKHAMKVSFYNMEGDPFQHHGEQWHFMPRKPGAAGEASVLWQPGCASIEQQTCAAYAAELRLDGDMPQRASLMDTIWAAAEHSSDSGYSRAALANLLRWRASVVERNGRLFSDKEAEQLTEQARDIEAQLKSWVPSTFAQFYTRARASGDPRLTGKTELELQALFTDARARIAAVADSELGDLKRVRKRLQAQAERVITWQDVFGDQAERPDLDLDALLSEWLQLADVQQAAKLAKIQTASLRQTA